jgi:hypothetical protein
MVNELTNIENQVHPASLWAAFSEHIPELPENFPEFPNGTVSHKTAILKIPNGYFTTLEKFKRLFFNELCRIRYALQEGKIHKTREVFSSYISANYSYVIQMLRNTHAKKYPDAEEGTFIYASDYFQNTLALIYYNLQKILLLPLKEFIEHEYGTELLKSALLESSSQSLLHDLFKNQVNLIKNMNRYSFDNTSADDPGSQDFLLLYNGCSCEADYYDYLNDTYERFQSRLSDELRNISSAHEKMSLLIEREKIISSVKPLFHKYHHVTDDYSPRYYREDAIYYLKRELQKNHLAGHEKIWFRQLAAFTEIQRSFVLRIRETLKCYQKLYRFPHAAENGNVTIKSCNLPAPARSVNPVEENGKLQWRGNINQLITFFYDASNNVLVNGKPILNASKKQITKLLVENFIQKDGDPVNIATINTIFTPSKELKRPPNHKRIIFPDQP